MDLTAKRKSIEKILEGLKELLSEIEKQQSIQAIITNAGKACDEVIIKAKQEGLLFIDGRLSIEMRNEEWFHVYMKSYFQMETGEWVVKELSPVEIPLAKLDENSRKELVKNKKLEFQIEEPKNDRSVTRYE